MADLVLTHLVVIIVIIVIIVKIVIIVNFLIVINIITRIINVVTINQFYAEKKKTTMTCNQEERI